MNYLGLFGLVFLCGLTEWRIGDVQFVEVWILMCLAFGMVSLAKLQGVFEKSGIAQLHTPFLIFFILVFFGSLLSLRLDFYPPGDYGPLKEPPWASFVRLAQVIISTSALFMVATLIAGRPAMLRFALKMYVYAAIFSALWSILSLAMQWLYGLEWSGVYFIDRTRLRGFFVEGGPFGVFLASAMLVQMVRLVTFRWVRPTAFTLEMLILTAALAGAQSKAGILLLLVMAGYWFIRRRQWLVLIASAVIIIPVVLATDLYSGLTGYQDALSDFNYAVTTRPDDTNLVLGRLMAAVLLPRMVEAHPFLGIGIGNYSLFRNDPSILRGLPATTFWDLPGLGILGYAAELGIPLTLFAVWLYAVSFRKTFKGETWISLLGAYPLLAALFGVQINFCYPWVVAGLSIAAAKIIRDAEAEEQAAIEDEPPQDAVPAQPPPRRAFT